MIYHHILCFRFDSELQKVSTLLKDEKTHREKIQREKDQISAENYQATQELKVRNNLVYLGL